MTAPQVSPPPSPPAEPVPPPTLASDPLSFVRTQGQSLVDEASQLRYVALDTSGQPDYWDRMLNEQVRPRLDRLEWLRSQALALRGAVKAASKAAAGAREDAWDSAWEAMTRSGGRAGSDYDNARERSARVNLRVVGETRRARQLEIAADMAWDIHEQVKQLHEGMKEVRQDCMAHLRHVVWESTLER
jgi:hypothetical protein